MAYQLFTFPLSAGVSDMEPFNRFLKEHRVIQVERHLVQAGSQPVWTFCVEYLESAEPVPGAPGRSKEGVDYRALLPPADFAVFARLREVRKELAEKESVPPYIVFTNEQLAQMAKLPTPTLAALRKIDGVGDAKIGKYGSVILAVLNERAQPNPVPE